jgi:hypothetical protein
MMTDLSTLSAETCRAHLNGPFHIDTGGEPIAAELIEVKTHGGGGGGRGGFTLLFRGPRQPVLPQRIYQVSGDGLGPLALFLVPVGTDAGGCLYEAVFN